ncbi:DNA polymerase [Corynebacterium frankenforstense DSM 45800]|uniref:DNA polymerase n=2 Tax=Corynebacterium TaxID=1716 RepID=A0A1L7CR59_9CORY|nr:DNA polymerase [Corynebacterium frankenforstense DSM 45800]
MALWFPDWPVQAAGLTAPAAVVAEHRVLACGTAARAAGVRRGMRLRAAQALCPELDVAEADADRDARAFEPVAAGLDEVAASVEVLRPGLAVVSAGGPARFFGGEDAAVERLLDAAARRGVDCLAGVADELSTAVLAARHGRVVAPGASREFLTPLPLAELVAEVALGCDGETAATLVGLGVRTAGELAALPGPAVVTRFGAAGARLREVATAAGERLVAPQAGRPDLAVALEPSEPVVRVDAAAFAARQLAARLHARLAEAGVACNRLRVTADFAGGERLTRVWRTREPLTESATADRVRWQLDGWLTARALDAAPGHPRAPRPGAAGDADAAPRPSRPSRPAGAVHPVSAADPAQADEGQDAFPDPDDGLVALTLDPVEVAEPETVAALWGRRTGGEAARRAVERVVSTLGADAVLQPRLIGGRGVAERVELVPYGEAREAPPEGSWPGRIPGPLPARLGAGPNHPASRVTLVDASGRRVAVTAEAELSAAPAGLAWGGRRFRVTGWAGPWPVDRPEPVARLQVAGEDGEDGAAYAWLLIWRAGRWAIEALYT